MGKLLCIALLAFAVSAQATSIVFDQAQKQSGGFVPSAMTAPDGADGNAYAFASFRFDAPTVVDQINWRGGYNHGSRRQPVTDFRIAIYGSIAGGTQPQLADETGADAALLRFATGGNAEETSIGTNGGKPMFTYSFILPRALQAEAGKTYWLQIEAVQATTTPDWGIAAGSGSGPYFRRIAEGNAGNGDLHQLVPGSLTFTLLTNSPAAAPGAPAPDASR